jgi:hypothetical protein
LKNVSERSLGWFKENHYLDQKVWEREAKMVVFLFWKWDATLKIKDSHEDHICQEGHRYV